MARNSIAGMVAVGIYFFSRLALTPFILHYVSLAEFGLWSICFVILSYAGLGALGVNNAYIKFTAEYQAREDTGAISALLSTGLVSMGVFCVVFYTALYLLVPGLLDLFKVTEGLVSVAAFMIMGTALAFCFDFTLGGFRSTLEGMQEIALAKGINVSFSLFEVALILVFLPMGFGIRGLLLAYFIKTVGEMLVCTALVFKKLPGLRLRLSLINREAFRALFVFGGKVQLMGALSVILASLDRFVITSLIGLKATGLFEVGRKFPFTGRNISRAAFGPLLPAASYIGGQWERGEFMPAADRARKYVGLALVALLIAAIPPVLLAPRLMVGGLPHHPQYAWISGAAVLLLAAGAALLSRGLGRGLTAEDRLLDGELRTLYLKGFRNINMVNVIVFSFLMAAARPMLLAWVGPDYLIAVPVMVIVSLSNMIHLGTGPVSVIVRGINRVGRELEYLIIQFVLAMAWIPLGTKLYGINGTAGGLLAAAAIGSFYFFWRTNYAFRVSWGEWFRVVAGPGLAPALAALAVYGLSLVLPGEGRIAAAVHVLGLGCLHLALAGALLWAGFLTAEEKGTLGSVARRLLPGRRKK